LGIATLAYASGIVAEGAGIAAPTLCATPIISALFALAIRGAADAGKLFCADIADVVAAIAVTLAEHVTATAARGEPFAAQALAAAFGKAKLLVGTVLFRAAVATLPTTSVLAAFFAIA